jgi:hypothetical protein
MWLLPEAGVIWGSWGLVKGSWPQSLTIRHLMWVSAGPGSPRWPPRCPCCHSFYHEPTGVRRWAKVILGRGRAKFNPSSLSAFSFFTFLPCSSAPWTQVRLWNPHCICFICTEPIWLTSLYCFVISNNFLLVVLGFELITSTTWGLPPALFALVIFQIGSHFCCWLTSYCDSLTSASWVVRMRDVNHHARFSGWDGIWRTFCMDWPQTMILPISAFQVATARGWALSF